MKKGIKIISLVSFTILYSFLISVYSTNVYFDTHSTSQIGVEEDQLFSSASSIQLWITPPAGSTISVLNPTIPFSGKDPLVNVTTCLKTAELFLFSFYSQYSFFSQNFTVGLRKTDIIFPFHYFT